MAKVQHTSVTTIINQTILKGKDRGVLHLKANNKNWDGLNIEIKGNNLINFGTCGYLGIETNQKLKAAAIEFLERYGTQFSVSRTYLFTEENARLEALLKQIFNNRNSVVFSSTSLAHNAVLPILVEREDLIISDQQAHFSIQSAIQIASSKGVTIDMIRHNNMEMLERKIKENRDKYDKIWYMIDGVYSMYGDLPDLEALIMFTEKYPNFYVYVDDAHGMSWTGTHGNGNVIDKIGDNEQFVVISTLAKGFGVVGGVVIFPTEEMYRKIETMGGALSYSHPLSPPVLGASLASASIHLSDEIYDLQRELKIKVNYCNEQFKNSGLPIVSNPETPIFFVGTGQPSVGYNLNKRIIDEGYYINLGVFPAVGMKNTGLRFTVTNHVSKQDIKGLVDAIKYHYPKALEEEGFSDAQVKTAFRLDTSHKINGFAKRKSEFTIEKYDSVVQIDKDLWNSMFQDKGHHDYDGLLSIERAFSDNESPYQNWKFHYFLVKNQEGKIVLGTFFTEGLFKDDLLSPSEVSEVVEERRKSNPEYLVSKMIMMGSLMTEGNHLYLDRNQKNYLGALDKLLKSVDLLKEKANANSVLFRDFREDKKLENYFYDKGYIAVNMPNTNILEDVSFNKEYEFFESLSSRNRRHIRNDVFKTRDLTNISVTTNLEEDELKLFYEMFLSVKKQNYSINFFDYPFELFKEMNNNPNWEFIVIKELNNNKIIGIVACYKTSKIYSPVLVGLDYEFNSTHKTYKHAVYNVVLRANELKISQINFGLSADTEKRKVGARQIDVKAYITVTDNYNRDELLQIENNV